MVENPEQPPIVPVEDVARRYALEERRMTLDAGVLGRFFGSATYAPTNSAGFVVCLLVVIICVVGLLKMPTAEFVERIIPIVTLALGLSFRQKRTCRVRC